MTAPWPPPWPNKEPPMIAAPPPVPAAHAPTAHAAAATARAPRYGFAGADLGMDFAAWRASSPTAAAAPCRPVGDAQVCAVGSPDLGGDYRARDLTFTFLGGRLAAIDFKSSIDGFDYATAALKKRFGAPTTIVRSQFKSVDGVTLPHVAMIWRNGRSTIRLSDPIRSSLSLSVRLSLDAAANRLPPSAV
jgi:hypothetical protein